MTISKQTNIQEFLEICSDRIDKNLKNYYQQYSDASPLIEAVMYASLANGKRFRPALVYATAEAIEYPIEAVDDIACAVELIHSYSLVHDDLPAIDDDDIRRGRPSVHKQFDEACAILAGDAMHASAFELLIHSKQLTAQQKVDTIKILSSLTGLGGMTLGQAINENYKNSEPDISSLEKLHRLKTGALIQSCILMVLACCPTIPEQKKTALYNFSTDIGLCFQISDDLLDIETQKEKTVSYPALLGVKNTKKELSRLCNLCIEHLGKINNNVHKLRQLTQYIITREF